MSRTGAPPPAPVTGAEAVRVALVAACWHPVVMAGLLDGARRALLDAGTSDVLEVRVPGSFELPVAAARLAAEVDAIVALGVIIRGGTPHFDYVCQATALGLTQVSVRSAIPVGFGVLTCDTEAQALDRAGLPGSGEDKGYEAASAVLQTAVVLAGHRR